MTKTLNDPELQAYYDDMFAMYGMTGWHRLMRDMDDLKIAVGTLDGVDTVEQLWFRKGQLDLIARMTTHQALMEQAHSEDLAEQEGKEAEAGTGGKAKVVSSGEDPFT